MSLLLSYSDPKVLVMSDGGGNYLKIGDATIAGRDVVELVMYWLTNTDRVPDDMRNELVERVRNMEIGRGFNPGRDRWKERTP